MRNVIAIEVLAFALMGCQQADPPPRIRLKSPEPGGLSLAHVHESVAPGPSKSYIGSESCVECHAKICESYSRTAMGRSAAPASAAPVIENYDQDWVVASHGFRYRAERKDGKIIHHERLLDADGEVLAAHSEPVDWEIGSGTRGRSYLIQRGDQMVMSPLTWYTMGGRFDISPGYKGTNRHFERPIGDGCTQCHVGQIARAASDRRDRFANPAFTVAQIDCERCHGPAADHVRRHRETESGRLGTEKSDPIVNPASLSPRLRDSVCYQCHLLGVERVLRLGRSETDFRPGQALSDVWVILHKDYAGVDVSQTTDAVNQVLQMESSRCFQKSEGRFSCVSCHDPHATPAAENREQFYREKCVACHQSPEKECSVPEPQRLSRSESDSCIECHMPALKSRDVQHTSQTDHRVRRNPARPDAVAAAEGPFELFHGMGNLPDWEKARARGLLLVRAASEQQNRTWAQRAIEVLGPLDEAGLRDAEVKSALGDASMALRHVDVAVDYWKAALRIDPQFLPALRNLAIDNHDRGNDREAEAQLRQVLESGAEDRIVVGRYVDVLAKLGRLDEARARAESAIRKFPMDLQLRNWLANYYQSTGNESEAEKHRRVVERLRFRTGTDSSRP